MNIPKILACIIFILLGGAVSYKGIQTTRAKGIGSSYVDLATGIAFIIIGSLIGLGYIN